MSYASGTITTQENDQYQDEMIEDLFSVENFSEVDTCVEIMGATGSTRQRVAANTSLASRRSYKSYTSSQQSRSLRSSSVQRNKGGGGRQGASSLSGVSKTTNTNTTTTDCNNTLGGNTLTTPPGARMQPIDEDDHIHNMVREDVRKMIARIKTAKHQQQHQKHHGPPNLKIKQQIEEEETDKMIINPGKYGEVDPRSPGAMARKQLLQKMKKDKAAKKKKQHATTTSKSPSLPSTTTSATTTRPATKTTTEESRKSRDNTVEQREGIWEEQNPAEEKGGRQNNGRSVVVVEQQPKKGYYKNKPEDGQEHMASTLVVKGKESKSLKQPDQGIPSNGSVASRKSARSAFSSKSASTSLASKARARKNQAANSNDTTGKKKAADVAYGNNTSMSRKRDADGVTKIEITRASGPTSAAKRANTGGGGTQPTSETGESVVTSVAGGSKQQQKQQGPSSSSPPKHASTTSSVGSQGHQLTSSVQVSRSHTTASGTITNESTNQMTDSLISSKGSGSLSASMSHSKNMEESTTTSKSRLSDRETHPEPGTGASEAQRSEEAGAKTGHTNKEADKSVDAIEMIERTIEKINQLPEPDQQEGMEKTVSFEKIKDVSDDDLDLSLEEWKVLHHPILSMPMTQFGNGRDVDESEEIECVLAPFGALALDHQSDPSIKPDPSAGDGLKNDGEESGSEEQAQEEEETRDQSSEEEKQERGVSPPGERPQVSEQEEDDAGSPPNDVGNMEELDVHDDISSLLALSNLSGVQPLTIMSIKHVDLDPKQTGTSDPTAETQNKKRDTSSLIAAMQRDIGSSSVSAESESSSPCEDTTEETTTSTTPTVEAANVDPTLAKGPLADSDEDEIGEETGEASDTAEATDTAVEDTTDPGEDTAGEETAGEETTGEDADDDDDGTVELVLVDDTIRMQQLEYENARLKDTLHFLQQTAVEKERYFAELAWFGKRSEEEVQKWRPNFWRERLEDLGPELFEEFRADAMRIADPDVGDWEHGFSSGSLAMARLLLGLSHAQRDEKICAFHDPGQPCTRHCVTCTVAEQRKRELADFPVLDP